MFVVHDVLLDVAFGVARPRLARVKFLPPVERPDTTTVGLRWEASGSAPGLFPVLDADITLAVASEHTSTLTLSGVYRPASDGAALNGTALNGAAVLGAPVPDETAPGLVADVAVRSLLRYAAAYLTQ